MPEEQTPCKRGYDLRKRLESMDQTRHAVLEAARRRLEAQGYRQMTMAALAAESGVTRQTIHNLFGSKRGVLEALFDTLALEGGMERMRDVMHQPEPEERLKAFVKVFCQFWEKHRLLFRRIHGIGAIDPDFGSLVDSRNQRRHGIALRMVAVWKSDGDESRAAAALTSLTSFEFYDATLQCGQSAQQAESIIINLALAVLQAVRQ